MVRAERHGATPTKRSRRIGKLSLGRFPIEVRRSALACASGGSVSLTVDALQDAPFARSDVTYCLAASLPCTSARNARARANCVS